MLPLKKEGNVLRQEMKKALDDELHRIFTLVNDWLKFAEAKNGALFALSGAGVAAILSFFASKENLAFHWKAGLIASFMFLCVAAVFAIFSFLPAIKFVSHSYGAPDEQDNLIFFGHIAKYLGQEELLVTRIYTWYVLNQTDPVPDPAEFSFSRLHLHLAHQMINNSQLAMRKFKWAGRSVGAIVAAGVSAIIIPVFIVLVKLI